MAKGSILKYIHYLSYVIRHKWYVMLECFKQGIYWQGLIHDISKFYPDEFIAYANHFYGNSIGIDTGRDKTGYYKPTDTGDKKFDYAWLLHQKRNKHHWQWWCLPEDNGGIKVLDIPIIYRKEMLSDWRGAGKAQGKPDTLAWYTKNRNKLMIMDDVRDWIELEVGYDIPR